MHRVQAKRVAGGITMRRPVSALGVNNGWAAKF
jgi:hypothetical protein